MEGTAGVCSWRQCDPENAHEYPTYRRYMTQEVAAAIAGANEAGVADVLVNDSHWSMRNLLWDELPQGERVRVISGTPKPFSMGQGLEPGFDAVFFTGYHAKAGDAATLAHTSSDATIYNVTINGTRCSEALLFAALAGSYGVPVVLITGDRAIVDEATAAMPWAVGVAVKDQIGFSAVNSLTPVAAQRAIRDGAREAIGRIERAKPFVFDAPYELEIETVTVEQAEFAELLPGFVRTSGRSVAFKANDYRATLQAYLVALRLAGAANSVA